MTGVNCSGLSDYCVTSLSEYCTLISIALNLSIFRREAPRMMKILKSRLCEEQFKELWPFCFKKEIEKRHDSWL